MPIEDKESGRCPIECPNSAELVASEKKKILLECGIAMARPGLEPGTPRFSVVEQILSNSAESPAIWWFIYPCDHQLNDRKLRSLLADLGTGKRASAQWRGI